MKTCFINLRQPRIAENVAKQWNVSRQEQDEFAAHSQQKIGVSLQGDCFADEIVPVQVKQRRGQKLLSLDI